jgi:predicted HTH transcriptional regulator
MNDKVNDKMNDNVEFETILRHLAENGEISAQEAVKAIKRSHSTARRVLLRLVDKGIVVSTGANRNRKYKAAKIPE